MWIIQRFKRLHLFGQKYHACDIDDPDIYHAKLDFDTNLNFDANLNIELYYLTTTTSTHILPTTHNYVLHHILNFLLDYLTHTQPHCFHGRSSRPITTCPGGAGVTCPAGTTTTFQVDNVSGTASLISFPSPPTSPIPHTPPKYPTIVMTADWNLPPDSGRRSARRRTSVRGLGRRSLLCQPNGGMPLTSAYITGFSLTESSAYGTFAFTSQATTRSGF
ncbi:hypothetical protein MMC08_007892 [Hypocenomyce scalaris]|nr:hypothetical protein [Hypocenomyce scalaris]